MPRKNGKICTAEAKLRRQIESEMRKYYAKIMAEVTEGYIAGGQGKQLPNYPTLRKLGRSPEAEFGKNI